MVRRYFILAFLSAIIILSVGRLCRNLIGENGEFSPMVTGAIDGDCNDCISAGGHFRIETMAFEKPVYRCKIGTYKTILPRCYPMDSKEPIICYSSDEGIVRIENGMIFGAGYGTTTVTAVGAYSGIKTSCKVKVCDLKQVAITFDDGPGIYTPRLLDFFKENDCKATFFMVVNLVPWYEDTVRRMASEGHELGYHSYDHEFQTKIPLSEVAEKYAMSQDILYELTGKRATVWRSPGGYFNQDVMDTIGLPHIYWTVDTRDWEEKNKETSIVKEHILSEARDGAIILLHDIYESSVNGAIEAMKVMLEDDYEFLTVTELISRNGSHPQNAVSYRGADEIQS